MSDTDDQHNRNDRHTKLASASARAYRKLLRAYPEEFRREYAEEMARYFRELCVDALREGGILALIATWMRTLIELGRSVRVERAQTIPDEEKDLSIVVLASGTWPGWGQLYNGRTIKAAVHALLSLALLLAFFILAITSQTAGMWVVVALGLTLWAYSFTEAMVDARRINAAQR